MNIQEFAVTFTVLFNSTKTYGKDFKMTMETYWMHFKNTSVADFKKAVSRCMAKYVEFPSVKEILDELNSDSKTLSADVAEAVAWKVGSKSAYDNGDVIVDKMKDYCGYILTDSDKNLIKLSARLIGGWRRIGSSDDGNDLLRRRFREVYKNRIQEQQENKYLAISQLDEQKQIKSELGVVRV